MKYLWNMPQNKLRVNLMISTIKLNSFIFNCFPSRCQVRHLIVIHFSTSIGWKCWCVVGYVCWGLWMQRAGLWVMNVLEQMFSYVGREDIPVFDSASAIIWQINPPNERPVAMAWKNTHLIGWYVRVFVCLPSTCWLLVTPQIFNVALNLHLLLISYLIHRVVTLNYGWELYIFKVSQNALYCYTVGYYVDRKLILM